MLCLSGALGHQTAAHTSVFVGMLVSPSPIRTPLTFLGPLPFEFPMSLAPIMTPRSLFALIPLVVVAKLGIIIASLAAFLTPEVIMILGEHSKGHDGPETQSTDQFPSTY